MIDTREYIYCAVSVNAERVMPRGDFDRSARNAQTRERLLEAAATVYARRGVSGATLDEVAAEAGFTKGAVYSQFGSKDNLLIALLHEHLAAQIAAQLEVFDHEPDRLQRPRLGSAQWMDRIASDPDSFRLFVELWVQAQHDERLRERLAEGLHALRDAHTRFAETSAAEAGIEQPPHVAEHFATVVTALGIGIAMLRLIDSDSVPAALMGAALVTLVRAAERDPETRELLAAVPDGQAATG
jgi:AcrR family transcriptional regulator